MRKKEKQMALDFIETLKEAHKEILNLIKNNTVAQLQELFAQCQEGAIELGNLIEGAEGENFVTVTYLECYCELIYQLSQDVQKNKAEAEAAFKKLEEQTDKIEQSIQEDICTRKEIVFFPYKASMWDALESVYLSAKADPQCDAYCVPIPYFDKKADGSLGEMHYEGDEYPENIEITDWQAYDLEGRRPDIAYIHNPYDNLNLVTCVHPRYFSSNLKNYAEQLIYIPYFVLPEIAPDNQAMIDGMKHFCFLPGTIYADKVILQSENIRQIYINEYLKAAKAAGLQGRHLDRSSLEQKFLGLGSPKIDKILNTKKEDLKIPSEWMNVIQKPDGSWKKIILYNTSITSLLQHNEKMLEKMEDVFRIFKEKTDDFALLWRPHPLIPSTIKSMRPGLWEKYNAIVEKYRSEGWGIYDDTADMDRAVVLSDVYYGDSSSVVEVYQRTGKLLMLQNVESLYR